MINAQVQRNALINVASDLSKDVYGFRDRNLSNLTDEQLRGRIDYLQERIKEQREEEAEVAYWESRDTLSGFRSSILGREA